MLFGGAAGGASSAAASRPNILLIVSDDQVYSDLGCFGASDVKTPRLDRLAAEGVRMTDFYVAWPACTPSRGSILTGRYPQRNGLYDMIRNDVVDYGHRFTEAEYAVSPEMTLGLDLREIVIAQPLEHAGYALRRDRQVGQRASSAAFCRWRAGSTFSTALPTRASTTGPTSATAFPRCFAATSGSRSQAMPRTCSAAKRSASSNRPVRRPFFLYLAFNAPHGASTLDPEQKVAQAPEESLSQYAHIAARGRRYKCACISRMDEAIGKILDHLQAEHLADNTLVIFCSDNGGGGRGQTGPLRGKKNQVFAGGLRVPLVARWPGKIPAGQTRGEFVTALELFPTLLAAAGASAPAGVVLDGFDMLPVLAGKQPSSRKEMFWQTREGKAARAGSIKWVESAAGSGLFDLAHDEGEQHDLSSERPELLAEMQSRFNAWRCEMDAAEPRGPFRDY